MKLLRTILFASALSMVLAPAASASQGSSQGQLGDLVSKAAFGISNNKAGGSGVLTIDTSHSMTTGAKPPPSLSLFITTAKGTKLNANIVDTCEFSELVTTGACPAKTRVVKKASAIIDVRTGGLTQLTTNDVTGYKIANSNCSGLASGVKMCVAVHANEPVTGTVTDIILAVTTPGGRVKLNVPSYSLPEILGIKPILTAGKFEADAFKTVTKKVAGKKKKEKVYLLTNPKKCTGGSWTISETRNYEGLGEITNDVKLPCKKK